MRVFYTSLFILLAFCSESYATTYIVNSTSDATSGSGVSGTLRWCLGQANAASNKDTITFNIGAGGTQTLTVVSTNLPSVTQPLYINGYSQPGSVQGQLGTGTRAIKIILVGPGNATVNGITVNAGIACEISGICFQNFWKAVYLNGADACWIWGCYIGTTQDGNSVTAATTCNDDGIALNTNANNNIIGTNGNGTNDANEGNLIGGNGDGGTQYSGECVAINEGGAAGANCTGNWIAGNFLGINESGNAALYLNATSGQQRGSGVHITNSTNNTIGTNADGTSDTYERNIISGNSDEGIVLSTSSGTKIKGNYIGTDKTGLIGVPNYIDGGVNKATGQIVFKSASINNYIGTDGDGVNDAIEGNVIGSASIVAGSVNSYSDGIDIIGASTGNRISGNKIGIGADGVTPLNILTTGITVNDYAVNISSNTNTFGTNGDGISDALEGNYVGNSGSGVVIDNASGCIVAGNYFGLGTDLTTSATLTYAGVYAVNATSLRIGSSASNTNERNYICNGTRYGIWMDGSATANADANNIRYNTIGLRPDGVAAPVGYNAIYIYRLSNSNTIQYNTIAKNGTGSTAGAYAAVQLGGANANENSSSNTVNNNTIYENYGPAIGILNSSSATNKITQNSIYNNGNASDATGQLKLGIDLNNNGVTANDNLDPDAGPNALCNFPVITGIIPGGSTCIAAVSGTFNGLASTQYTVEVFTSDICNGDNAGTDYYSNSSNNYGEGKTYVGVSAAFTTNASGNGTWSLNVTLSSITGKYVTAVAIQTGGALLNSTSEFSQCFPIAPDFGDAPNSYSTLLASCGPVHLNSSATLRIGGTADTDNDGAPSVLADGDGADEDGMSYPLPTLHTKSTSYTLSNIPVTNSTGSAATLYAWVDFDRDGAFEVGEYTSASVPSTGAQTVNLTWNLAGFTCGTTINRGQSYIRMRLTTSVLTDAGGTPAVDERCQGVATNGEVEDYQIYILGVDMGDLPVSYPHATAVAYEDATTDKVWLGSTKPSRECTAKYSADAYGDGSEEDGITFSYGPTGVSYTWVIGLNSNTAGQTVYWGMWIDWDANSSFVGAGDVFYSGSMVCNGLTTTSQSVYFPAGSSTMAGIRIIASTSPITSGMYANTYTNAEVEDYLLFTVLQSSPQVASGRPPRIDRNAKIHIFPNPAATQVQVDNIRKDFKTLEIIDMTGRKLKAIPVTAAKMKLDVSAFSSGTYLIRLIGEGRLETYQFVIL